MAINSQAVHDASDILAKAAAAGMKAEVIENPAYAPPMALQSLTEDQADLVTEIARMGRGMGDMVAELMATPDIDKRWVSIGATHLQQGVMALERAVIKPPKF
jgi:hypothetical protein